MLRRWSDQTVERHGARKLQSSLGQLLRFEDVVQAKAFKELVTDMNRAGFAMALGSDQLGIDGDVLATVGLLGIPDVLGLGFLEHTLRFCIARLKQIFLTGNGMLELAGTFGPLLARAGPQIS